MFKLLFSLLIAFQTTLVLAEDRDLAGLFNELGINGTLVLSSQKTQQSFIHNKVRANARYPAASTFKIANTLIALEENFVTDSSSRFTWNGQRYDIAAWNRDQTLKSAFQVSCVWCYQRLAEQIGLKNYQSYLQLMDYGQLDKESVDLTRFWLDGSLTISANEQIDFLRKVYQRAFPFKASSYNTLNEIMLVKQTSDYTIRAKTGWATSRHPNVGWYVGWVETPGDTWFFALNLDIEQMGKLHLRQQTLEKALLLKGITSPEK